MLAGRWAAVVAAEVVASMELAAAAAAGRALAPRGVGVGEAVEGTRDQARDWAVGAARAAMVARAVAEARAVRAEGPQEAVGTAVEAEAVGAAWAEVTTVGAARVVRAGVGAAAPPGMVRAAVDVGTAVRVVRAADEGAAAVPEMVRAVVRQEEAGALAAAVREGAPSGMVTAVVTVPAAADSLSNRFQCLSRHRLRTQPQRRRRRIGHHWSLCTTVATRDASVRVLRGRACACARAGSKEAHSMYVHVAEQHDQSPARRHAHGQVLVHRPKEAEVASDATTGHTHATSTITGRRFMAGLSLWASSRRARACASLSASDRVDKKLGHAFLFIIGVST